MNIHIVRDNLVKTIAGKEAFLVRENVNLHSDDPSVRLMASTIVRMLEINIDELKRILADVEVCCEQAIEASWALNPERMGQ
jgi:hypothetical protein